MQAEYDHRTNGIADHSTHRPRTVRFECAAPTENDKVALLREIDNGRASLPLRDRKTDPDSIPSTPNGTQAVKKLLRPGRPLMLGLVGVTRENQCPRFGGLLTARRSDVQYDEFRGSH